MQKATNHTLTLSLVQILHRFYIRYNLTHFLYHRRLFLFWPVASDPIVESQPLLIKSMCRDVD